MSAELIILGSAILGGLLFMLFFQVRAMMIKKQIPFTDIDAIVKGLFELELNREFFLKLGIGTALGAVGAVISLSTIVVGAPTDVQGLIIYGFLWGFAGNGLLRVFTMFPEIFTVLTLTRENIALKRENQLLASINHTLHESKFNTANIEEKQQPVETTIERDLTPAINSDNNNPVLETHKNPDGTITV